MKKIIYLFIFAICLPYIGVSQPSNFLLLDGTESIVVGNANDLNTGTLYNRTVEFWFKADDVTHTNREVIYEEGGNVRGINFWVEDGYVYLGIYNDADGGDVWRGTWFRTPISNGVWYHVALVLRDGDNTGYPTTLNEKLEWYLNGSLQDTGHGGVLHNHPGDIRLSSTQVGVFPKIPSSWVNDVYEATASGDIEDKSTSYFAGAVGLLRIWNSARTETQINDNKNTLINTVGTDGLVAYLNGDLVTDTGGDSGTDGTLMPPVNPIDYVWNGSVDNDWNNVNNWSSGVVPGIGDNVQISSTGSDPILPAGNHYFNNLTIDTGNILNFDDVGVEVLGDISVNGTVQINENSIVYAKGNDAWGRSILNTGVLNINGYLVCSNGLTSTNTVDISSTGKLDVNGSFLNSGFFTIKSDATGTGSLITNGTVSGNISIERYVNYSGIGTISSPVAGATSSVFAGLLGGSWGVELLKHTESARNTTTASPYSPITVASATALNIMEGYVFEMANPYSTVIFSGTPNTGDQTFTLTSTDFSGNGDYYGWNLVGNPYPSAITWINMTNVIDTTVIGSTMYVYNGADNEADSDSWLSFNPNDPLPPNPEIDHIPLGGAFFVKLRDSQPNKTITLTDSYRIHDNDNVNFGSIEQAPAKKSSVKTTADNLPDYFFQLVANANGKTDKSNYHWREEATSNFDLVYDSNKIESWGIDNPNIFFWSGDEKTSLQQEPETESIRVGYSSLTQGEVEISVENVTTFSEIILEDTSLSIDDDKRFTNLMVEPYVFNTMGNESDKDRFVIHLKKQTLSEVDDVLSKTSIYTNDSKIYLSFPKKVSDVSFEIYDMQGREVKQVVLEGNKKTYEVETNLSNGIYVLRVNSNGEKQTKTIKLQ